MEDTTTPAKPSDPPRNPVAESRNEKTSPLFGLLLLTAVLIWWIPIMILVQEDGEAWGLALTWFLGIGVVLAALVFAHESRRYGPIILVALAAVVLAVLWLFLAGTVDALRQRRWAALAWDLVAFAAAAGLTSVFTRWWGRRTRKKDGITWREHLDLQWGYVQTVIWFVLAWILVSAFTVVRQGTLPIDPDRAAGVAPVVVVEGMEDWEHLRIGLALSGGGYRAAVFHAGVLQALEELGLAPSNLSTVSGGSIIGSYYSLGGDPAAFADAVSSGHFDLKRHLLSIHNALRLPFPARVPGTDTELLPFYRFDRLDVQTRFLRRNLLPQRSPRGSEPHLMIATTDLTYGFQIGLLPDGILALGGPADVDVYRGDAFRARRPLDLSERVALSGAFPGAFPARPWEVEVRPLRGTGKGSRELVLVDGGVRDNLGLELLRTARASTVEPGFVEVSDHRLPAHWKVDVLLASDGGAAFGVLEDAGSLLTQISRTVEVSNIPFEGRKPPNGACSRVERLPASFSPARLLPSPSRQFQVQTDGVTPGGTNSPLDHHFNPIHYPAPVLRRLVELGPDPAAGDRRLRAFLGALENSEPDGQIWNRIFKRAKNACAAEPRPATVELPSGRRYPLLPGVCEGLALRETVLLPLRNDLQAFYTTPTLADRLPAEKAEALERLGKTLVYLQWPDIQRQMSDALACSAEGDETEPPPPPLPHAPSE